MEIYLRQVHRSNNIHLHFHLSSSGGHHWKIRNQGGIHDSIIFIHILSIYISYIPRHPKIFALYELFQKTIPKLLRKSFTFLQVPPKIARLEKRSIKANGVSDLAQVANFGKYIKLLILGKYIYIYIQQVASFGKYQRIHVSQRLEHALTQSKTERNPEKQCGKPPEYPNEYSMLNFEL